MGSRAEHVADEGQDAMIDDVAMAWTDGKRLEPPSVIGRRNCFGVVGPTRARSWLSSQSLGRETHQSRAEWRMSCRTGWGGGETRVARMPASSTPFTPIGHRRASAQWLQSWSGCPGGRLESVTLQWSVMKAQFHGRHTDEGPIVTIRLTMVRFEGEGKRIAVLLAEDGTTINFPKALLPNGVKSGEVLER
jgi:hypothetical protein